MEGQGVLEVEVPPIHKRIKVWKVAFLYSLLELSDELAVLPPPLVRHVIHCVTAPVAGNSRHLQPWRQKQKIPLSATNSLTS